MKKLLRVEYKNKGMYRENWEEFGLKSCWSYVTEGVHLESLHPLPDEDLGITKFWCRYSYEESFKFAFGDERQFLRWVYAPSWRHCMDSLGARLLVITVEDHDYYVGVCQAIYNSLNVVEVKEFDVNSFDIPEKTKHIREYLKS